ncbi:MULTISPECIES: helix-turn-helix domain-containing protein [unclassified Streptomyces]|uniref:helix-turn-helix domain-containing protein n=1 Tax=unclassified Streptomyces TaxID=2593676 RepID=UPI0022B713DF|nr:MULTISPECIES: helix-turn-helix transcriptional regulator [unclassified Streptomyces]MCZ7417110.1 helix-turn-helix transcriptional regulator [Streptomyces sp. WMMC897]MCZ7433062.1 helix-turn-helix transcriptional regulator [Streptomyces sp. WMMC1477]
MPGRRENRGATVSTVLGRRLGGELLRMREACGLRQPQAAEALTSSIAKVAKLERGLVPVRDPDVRALCHLYDVQDEAVVERLLRLAKADRDRRKAKGWWDQYPQLAAMAEYFALEEMATQVRSWELAFVPGLLQTPDYARALAVGNHDWEDIEEVEPFVEARMTRQARLRGDQPLQLWAIVHEAVLRQRVGGTGVMRSQLAHLLETAELPHIRLQVLPYQAGAHPGMTSAFTLLSFAEPAALDVVRTDTLAVKLWLESEADAEHHSAVFDRIARLGLAQRDSIRLIDSIRKEM